MTSLPYNIPSVSPREKKLLRRFAAGKTDAQIAVELGDTESRVAAQRQRLAEKFQIDTHEQLVAVADKLARYPSAKTIDTLTSTASSISTSTADQQRQPCASVRTAATEPSTVADAAALSEASDCQNLRSPRA
jgi:DNA-binding CsgD family transcriptional regulator